MLFHTLLLNGYKKVKFVKLMFHERQNESIKKGLNILIKVTLDYSTREQRAGEYPHFFYS